MLARSAKQIIKFSRLSRSICQSTVRWSDEATKKDIGGAMGTKFQVFQNETGVVFDIEEERRRVDDRDFDEPETFPSPYSDLNLERGVNGVFEIEDLIDVLNKEKARDLCVIKLPEDLKYVDYLCIANGVSYRHMIGMVTFVRQIYKLKRHNGDIIPKVEGEKSRDWIALDLGNIALHIFNEEKRAEIDLESLWCLGEEYEKRIKNKDNKDEIYAAYLNAAKLATNESAADKQDTS